MDQQVLDFRRYSILWNEFLVSPRDYRGFIFKSEFRISIPKDLARCRIGLLSSPVASQSPKT